MTTVIKNGTIGHGHDLTYKASMCLVENGGDHRDRAGPEGGDESSRTAPRHPPDYKADVLI
jgi:hypothetical protein